MQLDKTTVDIKIKELTDSAHKYAREVRAKWLSKHVGEYGYTYEDGEAYIRDPLKYEESWTVYNEAVQEYMDKNTTRVPNEMILLQESPAKKTKTDV